MLFIAQQHLSVPAKTTELRSAGCEVGMLEAECITNEQWCTFELSPVASSAEGGRIVT